MIYGIIQATPQAEWDRWLQYSEMAYFDRVQPGEDFWVQTDWVFSGLGDNQSAMIDLKPGDCTYVYIRMWCNPRTYAIECLEPNLDRAAYWTNQVRIQEVQHGMAYCWVCDAMIDRAPA